MKNKTSVSFKKVTSSILMSLIVASSLIFSSAATAIVSSSTLTIGSQSASVGNTINVPLNAINFSDVEGMTFNVQYDTSLLTYTGYTQNAISGHGTLVINPTGDTIAINWFDSSPLNVSNGSILTLNFTVISSTTTNANLTFVGTKEINDSSANQLSTSFIDGVISLNPIILSSIVITNPANKLVYTIGDTLDISGLVVMGTYSDASTKVETITTANVTGFNSSAVASDQVLTITVEGKTTTYTVNIVAPLSSDKNITSFSFIGLGSGVISGTDIAIEVPFGTNITNLVPTITITGESVNPASGVAQNFTNPVNYTVTAANSSTKAYTVTVTVAVDPIAIAFDTISSTLAGNGIANNMNDVTSANITNFSGLYFEKSIGGVKMGKITFNSSLDLSNDETKTFLQNLGTKMDANTAGTIGLDFTGATDSLALKGTSATIKFYGLSGFGFTDSTEANLKLIALDDAGNVLDKSILISGSGTYVGACGVGETECYIFTIGVNHFTKYKFDTVAPVITLVGTTPISLTVGDTYTDAGATASDDIDGNITAKIVKGGTYTNTSTAGTYTITYNVSDNAGNSADQVTRTININPAPLSSNKAITSFSFPEGSGTINESAHTIAVNVPFGTNVTALIPTITITGASINPASGVAQNFTNPVTYTVTAENSSTQEYIVTVTIAANPAKDITSFNFPEGNGVITGTNIAVTVPYGTIVTALVPSISLSGGTISPLSGVAQNFTNPVTYTVTAADASTKEYIVTVTIAPNAEANILSFNSTTPTATGFISGNNITLTVPFGTSLVNLPIAISLSPGASINPVAGNTTFVDGIATTYTVTAQDNVTTQNYLVTVTVAPNSAKNITSFNFEGLTPVIAGIISGTNITLNVPYGTNIITLVPTITITGASVSPASGIAQDFTNPVTYIVTAADTTIQSYTVTVIVAEPSDLTALTAAITTAQNKYDAAVEGNATGQYPAPLKANLQIAINNASAITNASSQSVVDAAVVTLNSAIVTFEAGIVPPDTTKPVITLSGMGIMDIYVGSTYLDAGATASDNIDGNITANIVRVNPVNTTIAGTYIITYNVSDLAGNNAIEVTRTVNVLSIPSTAQLIGGNITVSTSTPEIVVGDNNASDSIITIPDNVNNATINLSALTTTTATSTTATVQGDITINASTTIGAVNVEIPSGTKIVANTTTWNGTINVPQIQANSTVTATPESGNTASVSSVIEIGFGDTLLTFDKAVRIKIAGQAGKYVGYSRNGVFTQITSACSADSQVVGDALAEGAECKISVGSDLIIWTKHFTKFATYTQTVIASSGGGGGGGGYSAPTVTIIKGDINKDGKVDKYDFALMMANWGKIGVNNADLNSDNKVDKYDFALLMVKWGAK